MSSENLCGADRQLLGVGAIGLEAYLQGALGDGTRSVRHNTHRIAQCDPQWLSQLQSVLGLLGHRSWIYREGRSRQVWVLETTASFLSLSFDSHPLVGMKEGLHYVRGYFDAEGGMPRSYEDRLYFQFCQKDRGSLEGVKAVLESWGICCGRIHNPSRTVDANYWRFYVLTHSHDRFMNLVGSWHPRKHRQIQARMKK
jgi:hypothetical protein